MLTRRSWLILASLAMGMVTCSCAGPAPPEGYSTLFSGTISWTISFDDGGRGSYSDEIAVLALQRGMAREWDIALGPCALAYKPELMEREMGVLMTPVRDEPGTPDQCEWDTVEGGHLTLVLSSYQLLWYPDRLVANYTGFVTYELDGTVREGDMVFNFHGSAP